MIELPLIYKLKILLIRNPKLISYDLLFMSCKKCPITIRCDYKSFATCAMELKNNSHKVPNSKYSGCRKYYDSVREAIIEEFRNEYR